MRLLQYGVGAMGSLMVRLVSTRSDATIVAAIDADPHKIGRDLGEVAGVGRQLGVKVASPDAIQLKEADVALHATTAFADEALTTIRSLASSGLNVVTIAQELFFPLGKNVAIGAELDRVAKRAGVRIVAVGINPGFILDVLPIVCSLPCWEIQSVTGRRVVDFSPYGPDEMKHIGAGLTEREFADGAGRGKIGHIGLLESAAMVAEVLGLNVDKLRQTKSPIISRRSRQTDFVTVLPGRVCGFRQSVRGTCAGEEKISLAMVGLVAPGPEDGDLGDHFRVAGTPTVDVVTKEEISQKGGEGTAAVAVNTVPRLLQAPPGFHTSNSLGLPSVWRRNHVPADAIEIETVVETKQ